MKKTQKIMADFPEGAIACGTFSVLKDNNDSTVTKIPSDPFSRYHMREVSALLALKNCEQVVKLHQVLPDGGLVMDKYKSDLSSYIVNPTDYVFIRNVIVKVLMALECGEKLGIIHRDIKPGNILINNNEDIVVCDYNLSRFCCYGMQPNSITCDNIQSPVYRAPEIEYYPKYGSDYTHKIDIYSLGITTLELLGVNVFVNYETITNNLINGSIYKLLQSKGVPDDIFKVVKKMTMVNPKYRSSSRQLINFLNKSHGDCKRKIHLYPKINKFDYWIKYLETLNNEYYENEETLRLALYIYTNLKNHVLNDSFSIKTCKDLAIVSFLISSDIHNTLEDHTVLECEITDNLNVIKRDILAHFQGLYINC
jgi:serine/threonine protein kinase